MSKFKAGALAVLATCGFAALAAWPMETAHGLALMAIGALWVYACMGIE